MVVLENLFSNFKEQLVSELHKDFKVNFVRICLSFDIVLAVIELLVRFDIILVDNQDYHRNFELLEDEARE